MLEIAPKSIPTQIATAPREIAKATGAPVGTVMSRLARARTLVIDKLGRMV